MAALAMYQSRVTLAYPPLPEGCPRGAFGLNHYYQLQRTNACCASADAETISRISRGGPPLDMRAMGYLHTQGVTHIIDVRAGNETVWEEGVRRDGSRRYDVRDQRAGAGHLEDEWAHRIDALPDTTGMEYRHRPLYHSDHGRRIPLVDLIRRVAQEMHAILTDPAARVYLHCRAGADRTGTIIAAYEVLYGGCSCSTVIAERARFNFSPEYTNLTDALREICRSVPGAEAGPPDTSSTGTNLGHHTHRIRHEHHERHRRHHESSDNRASDVDSSQGCAARSSPMPNAAAALISTVSGDEKTPGIFEGP